MATANSIPAAGKASKGPGGAGGTGRPGLVAKLAAAAVAVGCAATLAFGGLPLGHAARLQPAPAAGASTAGTDDLDTTRCIGSTGPLACATGRSLAGTDDFATRCIGTAGPLACAPAAGGPAVAAPALTGETPCPLGGTAPCGLQTNGIGTAQVTTGAPTHGNGPADEYTLADPGATARVASCVFASVAGVPGEGCAPATVAFIPDRFTYREDRRASADPGAGAFAPRYWGRAVNA